MCLMMRPDGRSLVLSVRVRAVMVCLPVLRSEMAMARPLWPPALDVFVSMARRGLERAEAYANDGDVLDVVGSRHDG